MSWQDYFTDPILERGRNYYKNGRVTITSRTSFKIRASVIGYQKYNVSINLETKECYCDCRYGGKCKHLAATFYYLDDNPQSDKVYSNLLASFSYEELTAFLEEELPQNPELLNKLELFKKQDMNDEYYKNRLTESFKSPVRVIDFINDELMNLNNTELKLELMNSIIKYLDYLNYEGMYDAYEDVFENIVKLIEKLLITHEDETCEFLKYHILNSEDEGIIDYFGGIYDDYRNVDDLFE